ncbi:hypothetical protein ACIA8J_15705 [Streptomyces asoensis]|uniref:hypothetical protein n=1 Tax=Streptomyces asoensis TaxID=249586 RepID=UPI0037974FB5
MEAALDIGGLVGPLRSDQVPLVRFREAGLLDMPLGLVGPEDGSAPGVTTPEPDPVRPVAEDDADLTDAMDAADLVKRVPGDDTDRSTDLPTCG